MEDTQVKTGKKKTESMDFVLPHETVYVKFIPKFGLPGSEVKGHPAWGGLMDGAPVKFTVPIIESTGKYKNVLTNAEKAYLERAMMLDENALSVYKPKENFWENYHVDVTKEGINLKLWVPEDYIKYKVLLANTNEIAPDVQTLQDKPKATYKFVLTRPREEASLESSKVDTTMACYKEFGKIESDVDTMRVLAELLESHPYSQDTGAEFLRGRMNSLIQADPKAFLREVTDPLLRIKVILRRSVELNKVSVRNNLYYLSDGSPICGPNEESTLTNAARYLVQPSHSDILAILETEVEKARVGKK